MLSEEEKARIRAEEEAKAQQKLEVQAERLKKQAALEFRESVAAEINPKLTFRWCLCWRRLPLEVGGSRVPSHQKSRAPQFKAGLKTTN
jgi:hypothetical protein